MKKQRWRWTKDVRFCEYCNTFLKTKKQKEDGVCDETCYLLNVGMSWTDFIDPIYFK